MTLQEAATAVREKGHHGLADEIQALVAKYEELEVENAALKSNLPPPPRQVGPALEQEPITAVTDEPELKALKSKSFRR